MERANHRLAVENSADKKHIKSLTANIETLEGKCEELQSTIDDLRIQVDVLKRKAQRSQETNHPQLHNNYAVKLRHVDYGRDEVDAEVTSPKQTLVHTNDVSIHKQSWYLLMHLQFCSFYNHLYQF